MRGLDLLLEFCLQTPWGWLPGTFLLGTFVGSFLNVCIYRMPFEKSLFWPGSHCGQCFQPVPWYDNVPLLSYLILRGRCRRCGTAFSIRYFLVELLTGALFVGLFYVEVVRNVHRIDGRLVARPEAYHLALLAIFIHHAILACFLIVATFIDIDHQVIPLPLTVTGTLVGVAMSLAFPWPWPYATTHAVIPREAWLIPGEGLRQGLYAWPFWGPLPPGFAPGGNWQTGLATSLAGVVVGTMTLRVVRFFFGLGMGADYMEDLPEPDPDDAHPPRRGPLAAVGSVVSWFGRVGGKTLGLGDADLMMMAGAFLGWQPVLVAFFVAVFPGMILGFVQIARQGDNVIPFGPALALGTLLTWLGWPWLGPHVQPVFFNGVLVAILFVASCFFMLVGGFVIRLLRFARGTA
jgi:leader peptidase (prepilin peptidase)/N-methyltransferase